MSREHPDGTTVSDLIGRIRDTLKDETDLHTIILFGSGARGALTSVGELRSDLDLAVAADKPLDIRRRLELMSLISDATGREVDLVDLHTAHGAILKQILTKGRSVRHHSPDFVAGKALEMYDHQMFFEPILREVRRERIARYAGDSDGS